MPKQKPKHSLQRIPIEMVCEILSHLHVRDFARLARVSRWFYHVVSPLRLDYQVLSITKVLAPLPLFYGNRKIFVFTPQSCTYTELRKKLNLQLSHEPQWQKAIGRVRCENDIGADPLNVATEAMKAISKVMCGASLPMFVGALLDNAGMDVGYYAHGFSGFEVGYGLTMTLFTGFCAWMLKVVMDNRDDLDYQAVQLIVEDSVSLGLPSCIKC